MPLSPESYMNRIRYVDTYTIWFPSPVSRCLSQDVNHSLRPL